MSTKSKPLSEEGWAEIQKDPYLLHLFDYDRVVAYVDALKQRISELEKSLENAGQSEQVWRKRVEAAADVLADVLPGEVGRLDLLARIAEVKRQRDTARGLAESEAELRAPPDGMRPTTGSSMSLLGEIEIDSDLRWCIAAVEAPEDVRDRLKGHVTTLYQLLKTAEGQIDVAREYGERAIRQHGERIDDLEQHVAELEKSLVNARTELDEAAATHRSEMRAMMGQVSKAMDLAEQRLAERNATQAELDAALARLKPSGQVAEDVRRAEFCPGPEGKAALSRLAAQAQAYEALAESERAQEELFTTITSKMGQRPGEDTLSAVERVVGERDAAVVDNAALLARVSMLVELLERIALEIVKEAHQYARKALEELPPLTTPHPGAALLGQHRMEVAALTKDRDDWAEMAEEEERRRHRVEDAHRKALEAIADVLCAARGYCDKPHHLYSAVRRLAGAFAKTEDERVEAERQMVGAYAHHDEYRKALESQQAEAATLRRAFLHERQRADAAGAPPEHAYNAQWAESLLEEERRALARARREGMETAAALVESTCDMDENCSCDEHVLAAKIRAVIEED